MINPKKTPTLSESSGRTEAKHNIMGKIFRSEFARNVFTLASGAFISQLIVVLFSPVVTRLYGPEAFGVLGVFTSLTGIMIPIVALTYPMSIVLSDSDSEAKGVVILSLYIAATVSIMTGLILVLFGKDILIRVNMIELTPYMMLVPVFLFLSGCQQVGQQWVIRKKQYKSSAKVGIAQSLFVNSSKIGLGVNNPNAAALIILTTLGQFLSVGMLAYYSIKSSILNISNSNGESQDISLILLAKKYKEFPITRAPELLIFGLTQSLPVLVIGVLFGPVSVGFYVIGKRVLSIPTQIMGRAIGDVFYPRIVEAAQRKEETYILLKKTTISLALLGAIPFVLIVSLGPWLFGSVFGSEWTQAGVYARWMAIWTYSMFINNPSVQTLPVISEQRLLLIATSLSTIARIGGLVIGGYILNSDVIAVALFSIAGVLKDILLIALVFKKCKAFDNYNVG